MTIFQQQRTLFSFHINFGGKMLPITKSYLYAINQDHMFSTLPIKRAVNLEDTGKTNIGLVMILIGGVLNICKHFCLITSILFLSVER